MTWTLDEGLADASCGGLLVISESGQDPDLAPFIGPAHIGECFLIRPAGGASESLPEGEQCFLAYLTAMEREEAAATGLQLLHPDALGVDSARRKHGSSAAFWRTVLARGLELAGLEPTTLALGGRPALGAGHVALSSLAEGGWRFRDGRSMLLRYRKRKTGTQIDEIRRSAAGVCHAFRRSAEVLADAESAPDGLTWRGQALTAGVLRRQIAGALAEFGLSQPRANIVASGHEAGVPHTQGDDEKIFRPGETIVIDLFPKGQLFADCTRTFCVGTPGDDVAAAYSLVREALAAAYSGVRVGRQMWELQEVTCEIFSQAGRPTPISKPGTTRGYVHGLGHGVGFEIHEYPSFSDSAGAEGVLESGDVFTLEPGLYDPDGGYGIRLEDLCLATADGVENLTPLPYDLDPRSWR